MTTRPATQRRLLTTAAGILATALLPALSLLPADAATNAGPASSAPGAPVLPATGDALTIADPVAALGDLDVRGTAAPSAAQRAAASGLGDVELRWNEFGTPASILPTSGSLGAAPGAPAAGARAWLAGHAALLGLSADQLNGLELVSAQPLAGSEARAVLFRQTYGGVPSATGGLVTVGVAQGKVRYVSSSLTKVSAASSAAAPKATLTPLQGWLKAAADVGSAVASADAAEITSKVADGWTRLTVPGFAQPQLVRPRALALADGTVRPVLEANVVDVSGGSASAYTALVDGVSGEVLVRRSRVDNAVYNNLFTGTITATACGPKHDFELTDGLTKQINAVATRPCRSTTWSSSSSAPAACSRPPTC